MYTVTHAQETAKAGENVTLTYNITDDAGANIDVSTGVTAVYKLARRVGAAAVLTLDSTISFSGHTVSVTFNTEDVEDGAENQLYGDFWDQLSLTKSGDTLYVSEGIFTILPVIT